MKGDIEIAARDSALLAEELAQMLARLENGNDVDEDEEESFVADELEEALKITDILGQKKRKPKQKEEKEFDFGFVGKLLDVLNVDEEASTVEDQVFDDNFEKSGKRVTEEEEDRSGKGSKGAEAKKAEGSQYSKEEDRSQETCEETEATSTVKVCVPKYESRPYNLYFKAQETYDEKYCYTKYDSSYTKSS